jgi:hypothetical protein
MEWRTDSPDWKDDGKLLNLLTESGSTITGKLCYDDFVNDGEGGEYPIWDVRFDNGEKSSLYDFEGWSFA